MKFKRLGSVADPRRARASIVQELAFNIRFNNHPQNVQTVRLARRCKVSRIRQKELASRHEYRQTLWNSRAGSGMGGTW